MQTCRKNTVQQAPACSQQSSIRPIWDSEAPLDSRLPKWKSSNQLNPLLSLVLEVLSTIFVIGFWFSSTVRANSQLELLIVRHRCWSKAPKLLWRPRICTPTWLAVRCGAMALSHGDKCGQGKAEQGAPILTKHPTNPCHILPQTGESPFPRPRPNCI